MQKKIKQVNRAKRGTRKFTQREKSSNQIAKESNENTEMDRHTHK